MPFLPEFEDVRNAAPPRAERDCTRVWGDQAYRGQRTVIREHAPKARDFTNRRCRHRGVVDEVERAKNRTSRKCGPGLLVQLGPAQPDPLTDRRSSANRLPPVA